MGNGLPYSRPYRHHGCSRNSFTRGYEGMLVWDLGSQEQEYSQHCYLIPSDLQSFQQGHRRAEGMNSFLITPRRNLLQKKAENFVVALQLFCSSLSRKCK